MVDVRPDVQDLLDRAAVDDLLTAYTSAIDTHDWDGLDAVFTPDAHLDYTATGGIAGPFGEVKEWLARTLPMFTGMQHVLAQREVRVDRSGGPDGVGDTATVRAWFTNPLLVEREGRPPWRMDLGGVYVHDLVRTEQGWRSRRLVEELLWRDVRD